MTRNWYSVALAITIAVGFGSMTVSSIQLFIYARRREKRDREFHAKMMQEAAAIRLLAVVNDEEKPASPPVN